MNLDVVFKAWTFNGCVEWIKKAHDINKTRNIVQFGSVIWRYVYYFGAEAKWLGKICLCSSKRKQNRQQRSLHILIVDQCFFLSIRNFRTKRRRQWATVSVSINFVIFYRFSCCGHYNRSENERRWNTSTFNYMTKILL